MHICIKLSFPDILDSFLGSSLRINSGSKAMEFFRFLTCSTKSPLKEIVPVFAPASHESFLTAVSAECDHLNL